MNVHEALRWAQSKVGCGYVYGTFGQTCTPSLLAEKTKQYGSGHNYDKAVKWMGKVVYDCAGLIKAMRKELDGVWADWSADMFYDSVNPRPLSTAQPGDLLFRVVEGRAEHVGLCVGPGLCIEARGTLPGVVQSPFRTCGWTHCATPVWMENGYSPEVEGMFKLGYIGDRDHWQAVFDRRVQPVPAYIEQVFRNVTKGAP